MEDIKQLMKRHYITYASYVILDRAIPNVIDGLKPVQRRILHTLWQMHDGKLHKVANVAGQTMALHPHGDAAIIDALVNMSNKGYLLDQQGNFGNILTGDPAAAARYIETRLSGMAQETLFNPDLTSNSLSYDGRHQEPICLPAKIPVVLLQGADGIAVGMATHIFPHNFVELLQAEINILEGKDFVVLPDFLTGGFMDASQYDKGRGKVKLRAKIETRDPKTLVITEICHGTTTESLIKSIDEAAKKGKIKIEAINDYTADKVEIEIKLPRGQYAQDLINSLYAYTDCEVSLTSQIIVIKDNFPWETDVNEILHLHTQKLQEYLQRELEIERDRLNEKTFEKTLEQIFIENRLYKFIEDKKTVEHVHQTIAESLAVFHAQLSRVPSQDDREKLLNIPIRRISRFDIEKNQNEITAINKQLLEIEKELKNIKKVAIRYLQNLIKKYGKNYPRLTQLQQMTEVNMRAMETRTIKVGFDSAGGFVGTKVSSNQEIECTNFDKLLVLYKDGSYQVINIPEKQYLYHNCKQVVFMGIADKKTVVSIIYKDPKTKFMFAKRFIIEKFILEKNYRFFEEEYKLEFISTQKANKFVVHLKPKPRQKVNSVPFDLESIAVKNVSAKGIKIVRQEVEKIALVKNEN